jgi:SAM-dependent methyltransferase
MSPITRRFEVSAASNGTLSTLRAAGRRELPPRYATDLWDMRFRARLDSLLRPGAEILDVGAGRRPTISVDERPEGVRYVGLDLEADELSKADPGSYDETIVSAAEDRVEELTGRFDLAVSFFSLEHVHSTDRVLENIRTYLRPGGWLVAQLSGARSPFSLANRLLPMPVSRTLLRWTQQREPDSVFPARYDRCSYSGLTGTLEGWAESEVVPLFTGAGYVLFSRVLTAAYVAYEEWIFRSDQRELAPYYLVAARR